MAGLPPLATTGIGSLPVSDRGEAAAAASLLDVPCLPELPSLAPQELLLGGESPEAAAARVTHFVGRTRSSWIKLQVPGPTTVGSVESVRARALAMLGAAGGRSTIIFLDEPMLVSRALSAELPELISVLRAHGAKVGLHCCGETDWRQVLELRLDYLSFDASTSTQAVFAAVGRSDFLARGGAFAFGTVSTRGVLVEHERECLRNIAWHCAAHGGRALLNRCLLTPSCGLALQTVEGARAVLNRLQESRRELLSAVS